MNTDKTYLRPSHRAVFFFIRILSFLYTRLFLGFRCRDRYRIKKGESVLVLSNHQTDADPFCILPCFDRPVYPVATDNIFAGKFRSRLFSYLGVIPKKKGVSDLRAVMKMHSLLKNGGSVLLFPEGNRYYAEFRYHMLPLGKFIRSTGATVVIMNLAGGSGVSPRFKNKNRRGPFTGAIKRVIPPEEYAEMTDAELDGAIADGTRVYDSELPYRYRSRRRAEYLERMFFVCPACGKFETVYSEKQYVGCRECGMRAEFGEDLHFHNGTAGFFPERLIDWWEYQKKAVCRAVFPKDKVIFSDDGIKLFSSVPFRKRKLISSGRIALDGEKLVCGGESFDLSLIVSASVVSGRNLTFVYDKRDYTVRGGKRFDPIKYIYMFHLLDTAMRRDSSEKYFDPEA